ncbi:hypothetical protein ACLIKE_01200 [Ferroplasma acidiphilum]|uniref:Uncharacterized protein n=2 Tax=Ferroplasma TaxID=74968 RepID=S0AN83_FERAC|nr:MULTISPECIES: hypothetical protein [Ferroplasma]AGO60381.1 hypothetical protein FACI_IFERC00001G0401 [Ferroplasma acidarmanus Fer1]ARD85192.1 hypothetical protein FAD_1329 [Ferroplasma acidiphilum]NOL60308.1 hypothetical protein [Ferroplasma acidiphilum]
MTEVIVVHKWKDEQKDQVMKFATTIMDMAKSKKLPAGLKLEELFLADKENQAVCRWDVDTLDHLMETAKSMKPTWDIQATEVTQKFKKGLF